MEAVDAKLLYVLKGSAESLTSDTTLQDDNELFLTLPVGLWRVEVIIGHTGSTAGDIKVAWTFSGTTVGSAGRHALGANSTTADATDTNMRTTGFHAFTTSISYGADPGGTGTVAREDMILNVSASGVLQLQWAQSSTSATATTVNIGSRILATKVG